MMGLFSVAKQNVVILFASHMFIDKAFTVKYQLPIEVVDNNLCIQSPGGRLVTQEVIYQIPVYLVGHTFPTNLIFLKG